MNSDFEAKNILFNVQTDQEYLLLRKNKISVPNRKIKFEKGNFKTHYCNTSGDFIEERKVLQKQLSTYNSTVNYWYSFFISKSLESSNLPLGSNSIKAN